MDSHAFAFCWVASTQGNVVRGCRGEDLGLVEIGKDEESLCVIFNLLLQWPKYFRKMCKGQRRCSSDEGYFMDSFSEAAGLAITIVRK